MDRFVYEDESLGQLAQDDIIPIELVGNERRIGPLKKLFGEKLPFRVLFTGYIKNTLFYDTRQVFGSTNDYSLLFPRERSPDECGKDINKHGQGDTLPLESRLMWYIFGPNVGKAKSHAKISTDFIEDFEFFQDDFFHKLRLREIYFVLRWKDCSLLAGQAWHPMAYPIEAPDTVSFNSGAPIVAGPRNPQFRFTYFNPSWELWFTILSQADFKSNGPVGFDTKYARDAIVPNINVLGKLFIGDKITLGASVDYKRLVPRLVTNKTFKTNAAINSFGMGAWAEFHPDPVDIYTKFTYTQNGQNLGVVGAYAVHCVNPITDRREYTNLRTAAAWADVSINRKVEPGFFIGYLKNLGAAKTILPEIIEEDGTVEITNYTVFSRIDTVFRFSPRIRYDKDPFVVGAEIEYTRAVFGTPGPKGKIECSEPAVFNIRFIIDLSYFF